MVDLEAFRREEFTRREANLHFAQRQRLLEGTAPLGPLNICYVMTHTGVCGGTKIILEHANHLVRRGHRVTLVSHFDKPDWFPIEDAVRYAQVPFSEELTMGIPDCDVVVATYWREIYECILRKKAPVVYFEQGDYHLFDWEHVDEREKAYIYAQYQTAPFVFTVSEGSAEQIRRIFHRDADVIANAIDDTIFYPPFEKKASSALRVAMIGSEQNEFKRLFDIFEALGILAQRGYEIDLYWVSPDMPAVPRGHLVVNPEQKAIGDFLRTAEYFISASVYESFSLPVLEAMACGCVVLTTGNKGVLSYAAENRNCVLVQMRNPLDIANKLEMLSLDKPLRDSLVSGGKSTAKRYSWDAILPDLIEYYRNIARFTPLY